MPSKDDYTSGSNAKRLAVNTILMYIRMVLLMIIGFFMSRVLLQKLGITDFGIYSLVGSIIAMFSSMRGLFVTATQRFLNFEMGKGDLERLSIVFNTSMIVNLLISILFAICVEILGLWFIYYEINVPPDRLFATQMVLHLSVVTSIVYIMTTPLDALIIAHERIGAYAYLTIADHVLKLVILYFLYLSNDRLIFYALLLFFVSLLMRGVYEIYCRIYFKECKYKLVWDKETLKRMTSFAGWQFFGSTAYTLTHNGLNMILNVFGGAIVNAARGIAYQANAAISQLVVNMALVLSPYSVKSYARDDQEKMFQLFFLSSKVMFIISHCAMLPVLFLTEEIINLWLGTVPPYSVIFIRILMVCSIVRALHTPIDTLFKSVGIIKTYQITESLVLSSPLLLSYIGLYLGAPLYIVFVFILFTEWINLIIILLIAKSETFLNLKRYILEVLFPAAICLTLGYVFYKTRNESFEWNISLLSLSEIISLILFYTISLTTTEKKIIYKILNR